MKNNESALENYFLPETCLNYVGEGNSSATNKQRVNRGYDA